MRDYYKFRYKVLKNWTPSDDLSLVAIVGYGGLFLNLYQIYEFPYSSAMGPGVPLEIMAFTGLVIFFVFITYVSAHQPFIIGIAQFVLSSAIGVAVPVMAYWQATRYTPFFEWRYGHSSFREMAIIFGSYGALVAIVSLLIIWRARTNR